MKSLAIALAGMSVFMLAAPAHAGDEKLTTLLNATKEDYETVTACLVDARNGDASSWEEGKKKLGEVVIRVTARREALAVLYKGGADSLPKARRGLARMLIHDLDDINLSLLALVMDGRGLAGYFRTGDEGLVKGINYWREGIRLAIRQTRRCIVMAGGVAVPLLTPPRLSPLPHR